MLSRSEIATLCTPPITPADNRTPTSTWPRPSRLIPTRPTTNGKWAEKSIPPTASKIATASTRAHFYDANSGKLWLTFGSYFGYIRVVELDPKTGKRIDPTKFTDVSINMEATTMIYHDGWYYLLGTRGSCCRGADSGYNIRVGRSKSPTGPFVDDQDVPLIKGGGKLLCRFQRPLDWTWALWPHRLR